MLNIRIHISMYMYIYIIIYNHPEVDRIYIYMGFSKRLPISVRIFWNVHNHILSTPGWLNMHVGDIVKCPTSTLTYLTGIAVVTCRNSQTCRGQTPDQRTQNHSGNWGFMGLDLGLPSSWGKRRSLIRFQQ